MSNESVLTPLGHMLTASTQQIQGLFYLSGLSESCNASGCHLSLVLLQLSLKTLWNAYLYLSAVAGWSWEFAWPFFPGTDVVIVKSGRRICGTGACLANAPLHQNKSYFEFKIQSTGEWLRHSCYYTVSRVRLSSCPIVTRFLVFALVVFNVFLMPAQTL